MRRLIVPAAALLLVAAAGCAEDVAAGPADGSLQVVATTSILGDVVSSAFGPAITVEVLITGSLDPHDFHPSPNQVARLHAADLVVANGLGLEAGLLDVLHAASADGVPVVYTGEAASPLAAGGGSADGLDPHYWLDPRRVADAVDAVAEALSRLDPTAAESWEASAASYRARLDGLDADIRRLVAVVPPEMRRLVTNHDSLRYYADAYGFEIVGTVLPGTSTLAESSARDLARLVERIAASGTKAIFADATLSARLAEVVAAEVPSAVRVVRLYTGALGEPGSGAETYFGYMRTNTNLIVQALTA